MINMKQQGQKIEKIALPFTQGRLRALQALAIERPKAPLDGVYVSQPGPENHIFCIIGHTP